MFNTANLFIKNLALRSKYTVSCNAGIKIKLSEPPHLNWSSAMFRKRRTDNDEQTTEAGRDYHEVEAS